ncbi:MAG: hypothetical protein KDD19_05435 [Phaeodactylibacter sp.]|nr:hypothetical protein [Phaeodactylibacter sp.]MCB9049748.1 hypothetical protein [Lewinellaceae bacterium]
MLVKTHPHPLMLAEGWAGYRMNGNYIPSLSKINAGAVHWKEPVAPADTQQAHHKKKRPAEAGRSKGAIIPKKLDYQNDVKKGITDY